MAAARPFRAEWTSTAEADVQAIVDFIGEDSLQAAFPVLRRLEGVAARFHTMPVRGRLVPELNALGIRSYRELVVSPWRVVYRIVGSTVYVVAVIDGRRDTEHLFFERFLRTL